MEDNEKELTPITKEEQADIQLKGDTSPTEPIEKPQNTGGFYPGANNPIENLQNTMQGLSTVGLGAIDFVLDAAGTVASIGTGFGGANFWTG